MTVTFKVDLTKWLLGLPPYDDETLRKKTREAAKQLAEKQSRSLRKAALEAIKASEKNDP